MDDRLADLMEPICDDYCWCRRSLSGRALDAECAACYVERLVFGLLGGNPDARVTFPSCVGRITFANGEQISFTDPQEYIAAIREELPYHPTTGFRYETLTSDPEVRRSVDLELYDLYGLEPPEILT